MAHPIIGVWAAEAKYESQFRVDHLTIAFHADGTVSISAFDHSHNGAWLANGDSSARLLAVRPVPQQEGFRGWFTLKGTVDVTGDGDTFTMQAVIKRPRPDGGVIETRSDLTAERVTPDSVL